MYIPPAFAEDRHDALTALIDACPLALLVSWGSAGLLADPLPMLRHDGVLRAHLARANPQVAALRGAAAEGREVLAIFQGPQAYVSPGWYASKSEHGKVVPTWNYLVVQARAVPQVIDDPAWLHDHVVALTAAQESARPAPWQVSDAPASFVASMLRGIVGLELHPTGLRGKWKASQNRSDADRLGVIAGLSDTGDPLADWMPRPQGAD